MSTSPRPSTPPGSPLPQRLHELAASPQAVVAEMLDDLRRLVDHESPSSDHALLAHSAAAVADLGRRLTGVAPQTVVRAGVPHLRWRLGQRPARVLLLGHHDTVWPAGSLASRPCAVEGTGVDAIARGPGCFDMKGGLVQIFHALAALPPAERDAVTVLVTGDEEVGSPTSRSLIEESVRGCVAALVAEGAGPGGALKVARKGLRRYDIQVTGRAAHAGVEPERGANAGVELAHVVLAVAALSDPARGTTVTPTRSTAGTTSNTVPAGATVAVDVRAETAEELARIERELYRLGPRLSGTAITVEAGPGRPPLEERAATGLLATARLVADDLGLPRPDGIAVGGGSDGNLAAATGTPTLDGLGAVGGGAHAEDEHVVVAEMPRRAALLGGLVSALTASTTAGMHP